VDMSIVVDVFLDLGILYQLAAVVALAFALLKPSGSKGKILWVSVVLILFSILPAVNTWERWQADAFAKEAWAYYRKLCAERSGEKIYKTFTGVRSVIVTKPVPPATEEDSYNQFWLGDPYSEDIYSFRTYHAAGKLLVKNAPASATTMGGGFEYVEFIDVSKSTIRLEYEPKATDYKKTSISETTSRFALEWQDISTMEDRKYWVAGSRLSIIDLTSKSLIAERVGYFIEPGFGSKAGHRRPWNAGKGPRTTCPHSHTWSDRMFVFRVLNPIERPN